MFVAPSGKTYCRRPGLPRRGTYPRDSCHPRCIRGGCPHGSHDCPVGRSDAPPRSGRRLRRLDLEESGDGSLGVESAAVDEPDAVIGRGGQEERELSPAEDDRLETLLVVEPAGDPEELGAALGAELVADELAEVDRLDPLLLD